MSTVAEGVCRLIEVLCNLMLAAMTAIIATLVLSRNLTGYSPPWSEEITRYLLIWLTMMGATVLLWRNDHIRLDLLNAKLSPRLQFGLSIVLRVLVLGFLVILTQQGWLAALARSATRAPASNLNLFWPYLALPVGGAIMAFVTVVGLWRDLLVVSGRRPADPPSGTER
ncbi:TRAP transporter small permease [Marinivivus vitaminiproducens]|uniref:TRAP transporter small permease n=1 Tax=Marinivivus vitaminiproducens TaxID=3035935 RepID=UPI002799709E|nr:TRAP transporter small permease [Geminicoccaceae bacterium SCSIO 64248]